MNHPVTRRGATMPNRPAAAALAAVTVAAVAVLVACGERRDPCATLPAPTPEQLQSAAAGGDIEMPGEGGAECDLEGGRWVEDLDLDEVRHRSGSGKSTAKSAARSSTKARASSTTRTRT